MIPKLARMPKDACNPEGQGQHAKKWFKRKSIVYTAPGYIISQLTTHSFLPSSSSLTSSLEVTSTLHIQSTYSLHLSHISSSSFATCPQFILTPYPSVKFKTPQVPLLKFFIASTISYQASWLRWREEHPLCI